MVRGVLWDMVSLILQEFLSNNIEHAPRKILQTLMQTITSKCYGDYKKAKDIYELATFALSVLDTEKDLSSSSLRSETGLYADGNNPHMKYFCDGTIPLPIAFPS